MSFQVNQRVEGINLICRFTIIDAVGEQGTITEIDEQSHVAIRLDNEIEALEEWDNEITISLEDAEANGHTLEQQMLTEFKYIE